MLKSPPVTRDEWRAARRRARRRRRLGVLAGLALATGGGVALALQLTGGTGAASPPPSPSSSPATTTGTTGALGAESEPVPPPDAEIAIAAVGDVVMGSAPGLPPDGGAGFFADVDAELAGDVVLGNLEGTLSTGGASKCGAGSDHCFAFHTPPAYARWLAKAGFTVLNLANNHAYDYGAEGEAETLAALDRRGLLHTGRPGEIAVQRVGQVQVAVLGFAPYPWAQSLLDVPAAKRLVRRATRKADLVLVVMHAGAEGSDRQHVPHGPETFLGEPRGDSRAFAHAVVDAGADLVVGSGPHVLRGIEWYRGRLIAYSLGNFAGYGVFSLSGPLAVSGVLHVTLRADGSWVEGRLVATRLVGEGVPALDPAEQAHGVVRSLSREDFGPRAVKITPTGVLRPPAR